MSSPTNERASFTICLAGRGRRRGCPVCYLLSSRCPPHPQVYVTLLCPSVSWRSWTSCLSLCERETNELDLENSVKAVACDKRLHINNELCLSLQFMIKCCFGLVGWLVWVGLFN